MSYRADSLSEICRRFQVQILYAFGSRAGEAKAWLDGAPGDLSDGTSDLDIGAKPARGVTLPVFDKVRLASAVEDLVGARRVDLVILPDADPFLAANIIRGERLYASDEYLADEYDLYILRRAGDLIPLERERLALIFGQKP